MLVVHRFSIRIRQVTAALMAFAVLGAPAEAAWISGKGMDISGVAYLAVVNASDTGERIEINCTPAGQAFLALSWNASATGGPGQGALTLRFLVDGSHSFAGPARYRALDKGWGAAELENPDALGPLTEALSVGQRDFEVAVIHRGATIAYALFDMAAAAETIGRYRSYCRL
jgi:hypothetical protein